MSGQLVGQVIGSYFGPIGSFIGGMIGAALFPSEPDGPQLDTRPQSSEYGRPLPIVYGTMPPNHLTVIWASEFTVVSEGGKGSDSPTGQTAYANFAVAICEGERSLGRIWAGPDKRLIWDGATLEGADGGAVLRYYSGTEDQLPDPLIESFEGVGNVPGYRGTAYVVFENFPLLKDGNRLPFLTIEVGADSSAAPDNLGVVYVVQVLPFDDKYATFYWGTYAGVVIRYQADDTLYGHYTYDFDEWALTFNKWFWDEDRNVFVRYTTNALSYTTVDVTNGGQTLHVYTAAGGADANPGTQVVGGVMHDGNYVFAAKGSSAATSRVTLYVVDPATHTCTATYCGDMPSGELTTPIMAPPDPAATYVLGVCEAAPDKLFKFPVSSAFTPVDCGEMTDEATVTKVDPNTGFVWSVGLSAGVITLTVNDPVTTESQIEQHVIADADTSIYAIGSNSLTFAAGTPDRVILHGAVWLATDGFRVYDAATGADIGDGVVTGDLVGGYYGTAALQVIAYIPATGGLIGFREGGMMTFGTTADPTTLNFLQSGTFAQELDNKYLGEADGTVVPQGELLSDIVTDLSERAGLTAGQIDVTQLTDMVDGYCISNQTTVRDAILQLMPAYFFDAVESEGKVKFVKRGGATAVVIPDEDVGCFESGSEPVEPLETTRRQEVELPRTMSVRYMLAASDYSPASKQAKRLIGASGEERTLDMPLVFTDTKAQEVAEVNLHGEWVARLTYSFTLTRKYSYLEPTDPIVVYGHTMRLTKTVQADGIIKCEATHEDSNVYVPNVIVTETPPIDHGTGVTPTAETVLELIGTNMLRDADDDAGFNAVACAADPLATWPGAGLYVSTDSGASYTLITTITAEATMGYTTNVLGDFAGRNIHDESNYINFVPTHGTLSSTTDAGLLSGVMTLVVGDEVVFGRDATLESNGSITVRGLLRGRRGTEHEMGNHAIADRVILVDPATMVRIPQVNADIGQTRLYKAVTSGSTLAATTPVSFTNDGNGLKPYAVVHIDGGRNAAGDVTINAVRRARKDASWRDLVDVPLDEASEAYVCEVWDSTYTTLKRTISGLTSPTTTYLASDQTTDFGAPQEPVYVKWHQLSAVVGRGHVASGSV